MARSARKLTPAHQEAMDRRQSNRTLVCSLFWSASTWRRVGGALRGAFRFRAHVITRLHASDCNPCFTDTPHTISPASELIYQHAREHTEIARLFVDALLRRADPSGGRGPSGSVHLGKGDKDRGDFARDGGGGGELRRAVLGKIAPSKLCPHTKHCPLVIHPAVRLEAAKLEGRD